MNSPKKLLSIDDRLENALGQVRALLWLHEELWQEQRDVAIQILIAEHALRMAQLKRGEPKS